MMGEDADQERSHVGLCADCRHVQRIESARGSTFYRCKRSATDPEFPKYPRLPVLHCRGYEPKSKNPAPNVQKRGRSCSESLK
jgi:hypothetical protein